MLSLGSQSQSRHDNSYRCWVYNDSSGRQRPFHSAGQAPLLIQRQKHGIEKKVVKVAIEDKVQPGVAQDQTRVEVPGENGHEAGLVSESKENCDQGLHGKKQLLLPKLSKMAVYTYGFVEIINLWKQETQRHGSSVVVEG
jgi:hypothetical protein